MVAAALLSVGVATTQPARAANLTWSQQNGSTGSGWNWNSGSNWVGGTAFPDAIGDTANLNVSIASAQTVALNKLVKLGTFNLGDTNSASAFTVAGGLQSNVANGTVVAGYLLMDGVGSTPVTITKSGTVLDTISAGVMFNDALTITAATANGSNTTLSITGGLRSAISDLHLAGSGRISVGSMITTAGNLYIDGSATGGSVLLSTAVLTYGGSTTIGNGTNWSQLIFGAASVTPLHTNVTVNTGSTLNLNSYAQTIGSLAGSGTVTNSSTTAAVLTLGRDDFTNSVFTGTLTSVNGTSLALTKVGAGTFTLRPTASSTYTGATTLNGGTFVLDYASGQALTSSLGVVTTNTASTTVTVSSTAGLAVGMLLSGTPFTGSQYVASITDATHFVASAVPNASGTYVTGVAATSSSLMSVGASTGGTLAVAGGNFSLLGKAGLAASQSLGAVTLGLGGGTIGLTGGDATGTKLTLGAIGMTTSGGALLVSAPLNSTATPTTVFSTTGVANGIIGAGRAVFFDGTNYNWLTTSTTTGSLLAGLSSTPSSNQVSLGSITTTASATVTLAAQTTITGGATTAGSTTVTVGSIAGLSANMGISGAGIPAGSVITSVGTTTVTISQPAYSTASGQTYKAGGTAGLQVGMNITGSGSTIPAGAVVSSITDGVTFVLSSAATAGTATLTGSNYLVLPNTGGVATVNYLQTGPLTLAGSVAAGTIKIAGAAGTDALALGATNTLTVNNGILFTGSTNYAISGSGTTGQIITGNAAGTYDLILQQYSTGVVTLSAGVANNGTNPVTLVKAGPGALVLSGNNSFTGAVTVDGGSLSFSSVAASGAGTLGLGVATAVNLRDGSTLIYTGATGTLASGTTADSHTFNLIGGNANIFVSTPGVTLTLAGVVSGSGGLTVLGPSAITLGNGSGILKLSGANTFQGPLVLNEGSQLQNGASSGGSTPGTAGSNPVGNNLNPMVMKGQTTFDLNGYYASPGSISASWGTPVSLTSAVTNSTTTVTVASTAGLLPGMFVSGSTDIPANTTIASITNGTTLVLSTAALGTHSGLTLSAVGVPIVTNSSGTVQTFRVGSDLTSYSVFAGRFTNGTSSTGNTFTHVGPGVIVMNMPVTSTWTGNTYLDGGTIQIASGAGQQFSTGSTLYINNSAFPAIFDINGTNQSIGGLNFYNSSANANSQATLLLGSGTLTMTSNLSVNSQYNTQQALISGTSGLGVLSLGSSAQRTFTVYKSNLLLPTEPELVIDAIISGAGTGILKTGGGTMELRGEVQISGTTYTNRFDAGLTILNYLTATNRLNSAAAIELRGGSVSLLGNSSSAVVQNVAGLTLPSLATGNTGAYSAISLTTNNGQSLVLNLGPIISRLAGTVRLTLPSGTQSSANGITTTTANDVFTGMVGVLGAAATVTDGSGVTSFATTVTTAGFATGGNIVAVNTLGKDDVTTWNNADNVSDVTGFTGIVATPISLSSLRFNARANSTLTISDGVQLRLVSGGLLQTSSVASSTVNSLNSSVISGGSLGSSTRELFFAVDQGSLGSAGGNQNLVVSSYVGGSQAITKSGEGTVRLIGGANANDFSGLVQVQAGTIEVARTGRGGYGIGDTAQLVFSNQDSSSFSMVSDGPAIASGTYSLGSNVVTTGAQTTVASAATTAGSNLVTVASTVGLSLGLGISGNGIPPGTTIVGIQNGTTLVLSQPATATGSAQTLMAGGTAGLTVGMVITGSNIPMGGHVTSIVDGTTFTLDALTAGGTTQALFSGTPYTETIGSISGGNRQTNANYNYLKVGAGATLIINETVPTTFGGEINGLGNVMVQGNANLTLSNYSVSFGNLIIDRGSVQMAGSATNVALLYSGVTGGLTPSVYINRYGALYLDQSGTNQIFPTSQVLQLNSAAGSIAPSVYTVAGSIYPETRPLGLELRSSSGGSNTKTLGILSLASGANYITSYATSNSQPAYTFANLVRQNFSTPDFRGGRLGYRTSTVSLTTATLALNSAVVTGIADTSLITVGSVVTNANLPTAALASAVTTYGSNVVTVTSTANLKVGMGVAGMGVATGATVSSIAADGVSFTMSLPAIGTYSGNALAANTVVTAINSSSSVTLSNAATAAASGQTLVGSPIGNFVSTGFSKWAVTTPPSNAAWNTGSGGASGSTTVSIIPWMVGESWNGSIESTEYNMGNSFVTYDSGSVSLRVLDTTTEFANFAANIAGSNVRETLSANLSVTGSPTVNSLILHNNTLTSGSFSALGSAGNTLSLASGALMFTMNPWATPSSANGITLGGFDNIYLGGTGEYVISVMNPSSAAVTPQLTGTIASPLASSASITKTGRGTLVLAATNVAGGGSGRYQTTINEGTVRISSLANIGGSSGAIVFAGGTLQLANGFTDDLSSRVMTFAPAGGTIDTGTNSITLTNAIGSTTVTGTLSTVSNPQAIGVTLGSGGILVGMAVSGNGVPLGATVTNVPDNTSFGMSLNATLTGTSSVTVGSSPGGLTKAGSGTLTLATTTSYLGSTTVANGRLVLGGGPGNRISAAAALNLGTGSTSGVVQLGNASGSLNQTVSSLSSVTGVQRADLTIVDNGYLYLPGNLPILAFDAIGGLMGATAAQGYAVVSAAGKITDIVVTDPGAYIPGSAPVLSIATPSGTYGARAAVTTRALGSVNSNAIVGGNAANSTLTVLQDVGSTYTGSIGGTGPNENNLNFVKDGIGALTLSGSSFTYTGSTSVLGGRLNITGGASAPLATSAIKVAAGATLNLFNSAGQAINLGAGALELGTATAGSTYTGATLGFDIGGTSAYDSINTTGAATTANRVLINLTGIGALQAGTYNLITAGSGLSGATFSLGKLANFGGQAFSLATTDTAVSLTTTAFAGGVTDLYWKSGSDNSWSTFNQTNF